jgi:hypothetical protein
MVRTEMTPDQHSLVLDDGDYLKPTLFDPNELHVVGQHNHRKSNRIENSPSISDFAPRRCIWPENLSKVVSRRWNSR